jgi:chorismate dehydratase
MSKLKFGFHNFLNAQPLLLPLLEMAESLDCEICIDSPANLAEKLSAGVLDLAMIPSVEYLRKADSYKILPGAVIASCDKVDTVLFIAHKNLEDIQTIALDNRSKTSVALFQILFGDKLDPNAKTFVEEPDPEETLKKYDAALIIGDPAFKAGSQFSNLTIYDLSHEWFMQTGKPFVHAVIAIRSEIELPTGLIDAFQKIKFDGKKRIPEIAKFHSASLDIDEGVAENYLSNKIIYDLDEKALDGLKMFHSLCFEKGLVEGKFPLKFHP